ncbi:MAG: ParB/RepB/Spo0J family partition protein [Candidatus Spechtbacterales bacterium]|nr:ParB/RepB/Spo0J family partition protein [Candidatus Spechtbacterales bacterium]
MKGLESLIPQKNDNENGSDRKESVFMIDIDLIKPNPYQPRREFDQEELKNLSESISTYGVIQPLLVSKIEKNVPGGREVEYELIAGERRLRASKMAKLPRVPVIIRHRSTSKQKLEVSLIENIQRNDLNALEEAYAFQRLQEEFNIKQTDIAKRVSKSPSYVANTLRILSLPDEIKDALTRGDISEGHTRPLLSLKDDKLQEKLFKEIVSQNLNVRQAEARGRELGGKARSPQAGSSGKAKVDPELVQLVEQFKSTYNISKANVKTDGRKARLAVHFSSKNDLHEWMKKMIG